MAHGLLVAARRVSTDNEHQSRTSSSNTKLDSDRKGTSVTDKYCSEAHQKSSPIMSQGVSEMSFCCIVVKSKWLLTGGTEVRTVRIIHSIERSVVIISVVVLCSELLSEPTCCYLCN
jgi:hypothetical protein